MIPFTSVIIYGAIWMLFSVLSAFHGATYGYAENPWISKRFYAVNPVPMRIPT